MSEQPPAGWYPDPNDQSKQRYWNGSEWTEHSAPQADVASSASWPQDGGTGTAPQGLGSDSPDPWLWQSIVATLCCCLPAGIAGIVFAAQSQSAAAAGDLPTATRKAEQARTWTLVSIGIGLLLVVGYVVLAVVGFVAEPVGF